MKQIKHFILPEQTNRLYTEEALSSIALTKDVAKKVNELVDAYNNLAEIDLTWKQEQEGTIRAAIVYIKDNLLNTLHELTELYEKNGLFDVYVQKYTTELESRLNNLLSNATEDGELLDIRYAADGRIHATAGESIRKQILDVIALVERIHKSNPSVYAIPLEFSFVGTASYGKYDSEPIPIPEDGCSVRMTEYIEETLNDVSCKFLCRVYIGKIVSGVFVEDTSLTQLYTPNVYSNRIFYIPYLEGYSIQVSASFIGEGETRITTANFKEHEHLLDYVKVYTGKNQNCNSLLGLSPVTPRKAETEERYSLDWGLTGLTWKYQALSSPLPLKYVKTVSVNPDMWIGAKVYRFDPATRTTEFVKTLHYNDTHPCFGSECRIDFSEYGDNYFAILILGKTPLNSDYQGVTFGTSVGTNDAVLIGFDFTDIEKGIHVEWSSDNIVSHGLEGISLPVQKNIELLKSMKHKTVPARYGRDVSQTWYHIFNMENFAGIFYGGGYQCGTFYYHISPVSYFTALLNPNSNAYGDCDTDLSGYKYGIVCSNFTALLHGHPIPRSTFDFRYNDVEGFRIEKFNLDSDLSKLRLYDLLTQGAGETGHTVMISDVLNIDNHITGLKVMEAATPTTRENIFFLHNGIPYIKGEPETWYKAAYDYAAYSLPEYDDTIFDKANWTVPYTEPQKVMCSRGYGAVYLIERNHVLLSIAEDVTTLYIYKNGTLSNTIDLSSSSLEFMNGYKIFDVTEYMSAGTIMIKNNVDDGEETFYIMDVSGFSINVTSEDGSIKVTTSHNDRVKYLNVVYRAIDGNHVGDSASMCYPPKFENGVMTVPESIVTEDNGTWSWNANSNPLDYINVIFNTGYDTNTFIVDGENQRFV